MIACKPKSNVFLILVLVEALLLISIGYGVRSMLVAQSFIAMGLVAVVSTIFLVVLTRIVTLYRTLIASKGKISVKYHLLGRQQTFLVTAIQEWKEVKVKTSGKNPYRQLVVDFEAGQVKLSSAEFTNYDKFHAFLRKQVGKKQKR
ncbi:MAG: hypothetical protein AAF740_11925 [Bacteroidota bacterium]